MSKKAFTTVVTDQDGAYLAEFLSSINKGYEGFLNSNGL
jgi:GDP-D-mannose dehydratase